MCSHKRGQASVDCSALGRAVWARKPGERCLYFSERQTVYSEVCPGPSHPLPLIWGSPAISSVLIFLDSEFSAFLCTHFYFIIYMIVRDFRPWLRCNKRTNRRTLKHRKRGSWWSAVIRGGQLTRSLCFWDFPVNVRLYFQIIGGFRLLQREPEGNEAAGPEEPGYTLTAQDLRWGRKQNEG